MTNENQPNEKKFTTSERLAITGHSMILAGGFFISLSQILQITNSGKISEYSGNYQTGSSINPKPISTHDGLSASDYFRRG